MSEAGAPTRLPSPAGPASQHVAALHGVGMDLAEQCAFSHLDDASIRRAAGRWLRPDERAWCAAQASFREAMVIVLSCKEAVYKAWDASGGAHELSLTMHGCAVSGWAVRDGIHPEMVVASWEVSGGSILTLAVAAPAECGWHLLERILSERRSAPRGTAAVWGHGGGGDVAPKGASTGWSQGAAGRMGGPSSIRFAPARTPICRALRRKEGP